MPRLPKDNKKHPSSARVVSKPVERLCIFCQSSLNSSPTFQFPTLPPIPECCYSNYSCTICLTTIFVKQFQNGKLFCPFCFKTLFSVNSNSVKCPICFNPTKLIENTEYECKLCKFTFCSECSIIPYHSGLSCQYYELKKLNSLCRFCKEPIQESSVICNSNECSERNLISCQEKFPCGHFCCGMAHEQKHPFCTECTLGGSNCPLCKESLNSKVVFL